MLTRKRLPALWAVLALLLTFLVMVAPRAHADNCGPNQVPGTDINGNPTCVASNPGGQTGGSGGGQGSGVATACHNGVSIQNGRSYPCTYNGWSIIDGPCYILNLNPQPPASDPRWVGKSGGGYVMIYRDCSANIPPPSIANSMVVPGPCVGACPANQPGTIAGVMNALAATLPVVNMNPASGAQGFVNESVWFWTPLDTTPLVQTDGAGPGMIEGTRTFDSIDWTITGKDTNGNALPSPPVLHCTTDNAWTPAKGNEPSPDPQCSYKFTTPGTYTITVVTHWTVTFRYFNGTPTSTGPLASNPATATIAIGEAQSTNG